jgi:hypothetical protein
MSNGRLRQSGYERVTMRMFLLFWLLLIAALSLAPLEVKSHLGTMGSWHNLGHLVIFFVTTLLLCRQAGTTKAVLARCGAALLLALGTEAMEKLVYHNPYEWNDVGVDALGVLAALAVVTLLSAGASAAPENQ